MKKLLILSLVLSVFSCRKGCQDVDNGLPLGETNWKLYFKNNSTFSFFAESDLYFKATKEVQNFRNTDTISGTWTSKKNNVTITFSSGDVYSGTAITADSLSGTLTASGNNGIWYAVKK